MLYMGDFIQFLGLTYDLCRKYCRGASLEKPGNKITTSALMSVARSIFFFNSTVFEDIHVDLLQNKQIPEAS